MKRWIPLLFACLAVTACPGPPRPGKPLGSSAKPAQAAASLRVVALTRAAGDPCPAPLPTPSGTYVVSPVFAPRPGETLPRSMRDLCAYEWTPARPGAPADPAGLPVAGLVAVEDALPVVVPLGGAHLRRGRETLAARVDALRFEGARALPPGKLRPVMVGVLDTSPTRSDGTISSGLDTHGFNVAWIARDLTCPQGAAGPCASVPRMQLALGRAAPDAPANAATGGSFGSRDELASAVYAAVAAWEASPATPRLVLNLSVGWEPSFECVPPAQDGSDFQSIAASKGKKQRDPVDAAARVACAGGAGGLTLQGQSVHDALRYASCHGALVVAAAGNDTGGVPRPDGPMLPARWEVAAAPTLDACEAQFPGLRTTRRARDAAGSLVYAAGGVGPTDAPIPLSRAGGLPRIVAHASQAVAYPDEAGQDGYPAPVPAADSHLMTGTSVAAAVTSAAAALVWAYRPDLEPFEVMDVIHASGVELGPLPAHFCLSGAPCQPLRRVSLCGAVRRACDGVPAGSACPEPSAFDCKAPAADERGATAARAGESGALVPVTGGLTAFVRGQPGKPTCPECALKPGGNPGEWQFYESLLDPNFFAVNTNVLYLDAPTVSLLGPGNEALGSAPVATPTRFRAADGALGVEGTCRATGEATTAWLTWTVHLRNGNTGSMTEELVLVQ